MNTLDATVTKILSEPYQQFGRWFVRVEYNCWGKTSEANEMFSSKENAEKLVVGSTITV